MANAAKSASGKSGSEDEKIRAGAYQLWLDEGQPHGRDQEHWHRARESLKEKPAAKKPKAAKAEAAPVVKAAPVVEAKVTPAVVKAAAKKSASSATRKPGAKPH